MPAQPASPSAPPNLGSTGFAWETLEVKPTGVGERRDVCDQPTATLERFECHISTLNPGLASHPPHTHAQEELIILAEGSLDVFTNGNVTRVGPGSVFWFASNDPHAVNNRGDVPATYFVFNFATAKTRQLPPLSAAQSAPAEALKSSVWEWTGLPVETTATGERRRVVASPTVTCTSFSCHVTTVRPGAASHAPHRHADEEIILVKEGEVEVTINGNRRRAGAGSIFFFGSNDEHGLRNVGERPATYYVIRIVTEATPAPATVGQSSTRPDAQPRSAGAGLNQ